MKRASWIDVIEAAYDVDAKERPWLQGIVQASEPLLDAGLGIVAYTYDVSRTDQVVVPTAVRSAKLSAATARFASAGMQAAGPEYIRATYRAIQVETASNTPGVSETPTLETFRAIGIGDMLGINGLDPSGVGVWLGAALPRPYTLRRTERTRYQRLATHLAHAYRLRLRLAAVSRSRNSPWNADAIVTPRGHLEHATSDEVRRAREQLRAAAVAIDRARGKLRRISPDSAVAEWLGLADGRWSLVDKVDSDGKRFVLARRNEPSVGGLGLLTQRERAVAAYAAMGHTNKLIAYDLGIAHSTVRVLLARAASKLGARSRAELVQLVHAATDADGSARERQG